MLDVNPYIGKTDEGRQSSGKPATYLGYRNNIQFIWVHFSITIFFCYFLLKYSVNERYLCDLLLFKDKIIKFTVHTVREGGWRVITIYRLEVSTSYREIICVSKSQGWSHRPVFCAPPLYSIAPALLSEEQVLLIAYALLYLNSCKVI